ncbi:phosphotransferase [Micromonospora sp. NPDC049460]|uniref:phosphotransferase n=1 Tax=unclassified Micromonospora TaxID=2617518 RepID=UPI00371F51DE
MVHVPSDSFDAQRAWLILREACSTNHVNLSDGELIRLGENAVFWLASRTVVARVGRGDVRAAEAEREIKVARWLAGSAIPAVRPLEMAQPLRVGDHFVTLWESVGDEVSYGTPAELASLLRQLHALEPPADIALPRADPFRRARSCFANATALTDEDKLFISGLLGRLATRYERLAFSLRPGVVHGDANVCNVFRDRRGRPVLGDLDTVAVGPRELDLVPAAVYYDRLGWHSAGEYREFAESYGFDVLDWPGYGLLADALEVELVTWLAQNADQDDKAGQELAKRIRTLRTGTSRAVWSPFLWHQRD